MPRPTAALVTVFCVLHAATAAAQVQVSPNAIDFGAVPIGETARADFALMNLSRSTAAEFRLPTPAFPSPPSAFTLRSADPAACPVRRDGVVTVAPGRVCAMQASFAARRAGGDYRETLPWRAAQGSSVRTLPLQLRARVDGALVEASPVAVDLGVWRATLRSVLVPIDIVNVHDAPLRVGTPTFSQAGTHFAWSSALCPSTLPPGGICHFFVDVERPSDAPQQNTFRLGLGTLATPSLTQTVEVDFVLNQAPYSDQLVRGFNVGPTHIDYGRTGHLTVTPQQLRIRNGSYTEHQAVMTLQPVGGSGCPQAPWWNGVGWVIVPQCDTAAALAGSVPAQGGCYLGETIDFVTIPYDRSTRVEISRFGEVVPDDGRAAALVAPAAVGFAALPHGAVQDAAVTLTNTHASRQLVTIAASSTVPRDSRIGLHASTCGASLAPGASCTLRYRYIAARDASATQRSAGASVRYVDSDGHAYTHRLQFGAEAAY